MQFGGGINLPNHLQIDWFPQVEIRLSMYMSPLLHYYLPWGCQPSLLLSNFECLGVSTGGLEALLWLPLTTAIVSHTGGETFPTPSLRWEKKTASAMCSIMQVIWPEEVMLTLSIQPKKLHWLFPNYVVLTYPQCVCKGICYLVWIATSDGNEHFYKVTNEWRSQWMKICEPNFFPRSTAVFFHTYLSLPFHLTSQLQKV